ncbi:MAG: hypothetical protein H6Q89_91 [Myxococcaceae bacterium]|nr:hypothetical protein [Myxococcaceae bacterium]
MNGKAAQRGLRAAVDELEQQLAPLKRHATIEGVHQARASARRLGDTLSTFAADLPVVKARAGRLKDAFGTVRDLHVSGVRRGPNLSRATAAMRAAIAEWEHDRPLLEHELAHWELTASPRKLLRRRLRRLGKRLDRLPVGIPARQAHRLRMKTKRAHTAVGLVARREKHLLTRLRKAASLLGSLHDLDAGLTDGGRTRAQWVADVRPALAALRRAL